jgi:hypothetical protein
MQLFKNSKISKAMENSSKNRKDNPFEHDPATSLTPEQIISYYIEDFNYSRFIESPMNVFLIGERGSGKTMALRYHSYEVQKKKADIEQSTYQYEKIGIYVSCKSTLFQKKEADLIDNNAYKVTSIYEIFLVATIAHSFVNVLAKIEELNEPQMNKKLIQDFEYVIGEKLIDNHNFFEAVKLFIDKALRQMQELLNNSEVQLPLLKALNFYTFLEPLINYARKFPLLKNGHFLFLIDDIQDLNDIQIKLLNSWIAYRDHSDFSFKLSTTKVRERLLITASGGTILEGHDFMTIDMEEPKQNSQSDYGKLARRIIKRRLEKFDINVHPDDFFPENESFKKDMARCKEMVTKQALEVFGAGKDKKKSVQDYVYKYARAMYFRERASKANLPPYSGLETIIHLSTGVIRNLLFPCFYMYETCVSDSQEKPDKVPPKVQTEIIKEKSQELWNFMENDLATSIVGCSTEQAKHIFQLFTNLILLFKERLKQDISEPRAVSFTISGYSEKLREEIEPLIRIAREGRLLYVRYGSAKDDGKRELYYTPNRLLLPINGLDIIGQHARISLPAKEILAAAKQNKKFNSSIVVKSFKTLFDENF